MPPGFSDALPRDGALPSWPPRSCGLRSLPFDDGFAAGACAGACPCICGGGTGAIVAPPRGTACGLAAGGDTTAGFGWGALRDGGAYGFEGEATGIDGRCGDDERAGPVADGEYVGAAGEAWRAGGETSGCGYPVEGTFWRDGAVAGA